MASPELSLGSSLAVPSVQELAKKLVGGVPDRYLHPDQEPPASLTQTSPPLIPAIDMQRLLLEDKKAAELEKLHSAAKDWGFFQLVNHGLSSLIGNMKREIQQFFQLPLEEKKNFVQLPGDIQGYGQAFVFSEEQKLEWGDMLFFVTRPAHLRKSHLFENFSPSFRDTIETYSLELQKLTIAMLELMARALQMETGEMMDFFEDGLQSIRMSYYPPCPQPEQVIGLSPHSDAVALTILLQANDVQGLEIRKDGDWIPVKPLPDAFIVNIGDLLEIITNGAYQSVEHRVTVNSTQERLSISAFHIPKATAEVGPAPSLIEPHKPAFFKKVVVEDYIRAPYSGELGSKSLINSFRLSE